MSIHFMTPTTPPYVEERLRYLHSDAVDAPLLKALFELHAPPRQGGKRPNGPVDPKASKPWFAALVQEMRQAFEPPTGAKWKSSDGLPEFSLAHRLPLSSLPRLSVASTTRAALDAAVNKVHPDPSQKALYELEAPSPQTLLAFAAGLDGLLGSSASSSSCWLIDAVLECSTQIVMELKGKIQGPRPADIKGASLKPVIKLPSYSAYPGGHAATTRAAVRVLQAVANLQANDGAYLQQLSDRVARNRERAGLHHELDTDAGWALGEYIAKALLEASSKSKEFPKWSGLCALAAQEW